MAYLNQFQFCERVSNIFPEYFNNVRVLDIGSMDINGNNRAHFKNSDYTGIDIGEGNNVDVICSGHLFSVSSNSEKFNTVISTECFEHDVYYKETILNVVENLLLPGGMFLFTCATTGRPEHGTTRTSPFDSPFTNDYYKNLAEDDIKEFLDLDRYFSDYSFSVNSDSHDLYFWGIKKKMDVDVVMLTNSKNDKFFRMTKESIISLKNSSSIAKYNIILIEGNLDSKYTKIYEDLGCLVVYNNSNFSFSNSINYGLNHCKNRYVCLSNNDVVFNKDWFNQIYFNLDKDSEIAVYSTNDKYLNSNLPNDEMIEGYKPVGIHSGWCHVIDTFLLGENKYLDEAFDVWFMDDDFCMRLQNLGLKQVLVNQSIVYHLGTSSISLIENSDIRIDIDRNRFHTKYQNQIRIQSCLFFDDKTLFNFESFTNGDFKFNLSGDVDYSTEINMQTGVSYFISVSSTKQINIEIKDINNSIILNKRFKRYN